MFEKALIGGKRYWSLIGVLLGLIFIAFICYLWQLKVGLMLTGMSRDVSWGLYIAQFTYFVGVAAAAVMVVLPYYLHNYKAFERITILGEFMAVGAVIMCMLFIFVDLGKPMRVFNILLHPTFHSVIFWDMVVLSGYLLMNIITGWMVLQSEKNDAAPPTWVKTLIYIAIPWAPLIHTVTAFLYSGLPGRGYWLTAIMAPRFLSSAFSSGPAFLILLALMIKKYTKFDPGREQLQSLAKIVTYAIIVNLFFIACELFTVLYSNIPEHIQHIKYLFLGIDGYGKLILWMWASIIFMVLASILLIVPSFRKNERILSLACGLIIVGTWLDKGLGLISGGFIPNSFGHVVEYWPTAPELLITIGVWSTGLLIITILYKIAISVKEEIG